jgi:putative phosphoesterase
MTSRNVIVGIISDTHGLLRPQALDALRGADLIIHAGDVGKGEILGPLRSLAPTFAIRGNVDTLGAAASLPAVAVVKAGPLLFYVLHDIAELGVDPPTAGFAAVVCGHSHRPSIEMRDGVLYLNPGSAGPRRFCLPVTLARVVIEGRQLRPEIVTLAV